MSLDGVFLEAVGPLHPRYESISDLEAIIAGLVAEARRQWPGIAVGEERFVRHLAQAVAGASDDQDPAQALRTCRGADLYLACGCLEGDAAALEAFESTVLTPTAAYYASRPGSPMSADELKQDLRVRLLVSEDGKPRLLGYAGRGPLGRWVRATASRLLVDAHRWQGPPSFADEVLDLGASTGHPELEYLKTKYAGELKSAVSSAFAALDARSSAVLRLHFLEGVSLSAIATMYRVSQRTAYRLAERACEQVLAETRRILADRKVITAGQLDTILSIARTRLDLTPEDLAGLDAGGQESQDGQGRPDSQDGDD